MEQEDELTSKTSEPTHTEILDDPVGRAFVVGFMEGFTAAQNGEAEPEIDEIVRKLEQTKEDLVLALNTSKS